MLAPFPVASQTLVDEVAAVEVGPIQVTPLGTVTGEVINESDKVVRDVRVLIHYQWLWADERSPGPADENPGQSYFYTVPAEIDPGGRATFTYEPQKPLVAREGGQFYTRVDVVGWVEVGD